MTVERRVLIVAIVVTFCAFLDGAAINVALPAIESELGGGLTTQQWVVDGYLITLGAFILIAGSLSDSFGRVRVLRVGLVGFGITSLLCAVAPTDSFLIYSRVLQGAAAALLVPSSLALIIATFSSERQGRAIGSWTAWTTSAFIVGPLLGGILVDVSTWRLIFAINVLPIAVVLWLLRGIPVEPPTLERSRLDWVGTLLGILGIGAPVYALIEQARFGWSSPAVYVPLTLGVVCLAAFLWWEHRAPAPMMPLMLFRRRNFGVGNLATAFIYAGFAFGPFALTIFVQEYGGYSALAAGAATLPSMIVLILLASYFGGLSSRFGPRVFMTLGPLTCAAGFLLSVQVTEDVAYWTELFPGIAIFGLGMAITVAPLTAAILGAVDPARAGIASAINNAVARLAGLVAIALTAFIVGSQLNLNGYHRAAVVTAVMLGLGGIVSYLGIRNPVRESAPVSGRAS